MNAGEHEVELKFATNAAGLRAAFESDLLPAFVPDGRAKSLISAYFDTSDQVLRKRKTSLRLRRSGRSIPVMTLKRKPTKSQGPFAREEIEVRIRSQAPRIDAFDTGIARELSDLLQGRPLELQFETRVRRRTRQIVFGGSKIEAAFDQGHIQAGDRRTRLNEVELELKEGSPSDLYALGSVLIAALPLRLDPMSKAQAAYNLARNEHATPAGAEPIVFAADASIDTAIAVILQNTIEHFLSNWASLRASDDPESIHQMRVALRRMRSAIAILSATAPCPQFSEIRAKAKDLADRLGLARQCDVFKDLLDGSLL